MRKVYTITFHNALNYGAILQCVALYKKISDYTECELIDYKAPVIENRYKIFRKGASIKDILKSCLLRNRTSTKRKLFQNFLKENCKLTESYHNYKELEKAKWDKKSVFIVGSDQVWNTDLTNDDLAYKLKFVPQDAIKLSYAASIGKSMNEEQGKVLVESINDFDDISVRESSAVNFLQTMGAEVHQNIDPVFLLSTNEWNQITRSINIPKEKYILVYILQKSDKLMQKVEEYAKKMNMKIYIISTGLKREYEAEYIDSCGPKEFVQYFANADTIFTNSFHGISFSILYNKNFFYELQGEQKGKASRNSRLNDIIGKFNLENRNLATYESVPLKVETDYNKINKEIEKEKKVSVDYIMEYLN